MIRYFFLILYTVILTACATTIEPPSSRCLELHPGLKNESGFLLIVDVCLKRDVVGDDDFLVIENSEKGAKALLNAATQYFSANGVTLTDKLVPFVCGALLDQSNAPKRVAKTIDSDIEQIIQPFAVSNDLAQDTEYVSALQDLATYIHRSAIFGYGALDEKSMLTQIQIDSAKAEAAASKVAAHTRSSGIIYIGVLGNSLSTGKAFGTGLGRFTVGLVTGVATSLALGPIATIGGTSYHYGLMYIPSGPKDAYQMSAGLMDLRTGELIKSRVIHGGGDPMDPDVISQRTAVDLLLQEFTYSNFNEF